MKFVGSFQLKIDNKNRVRLPAKFRSKFTDGFYLNYGDHCITICSKELGEQRIEELYDEAETPEEMRTAKRYAASMHEVENEDQDEQGRFVLPQRFVDFAKLEKDIWFVGDNDCISLMSDEEYGRLNPEDSIETLDYEVMMIRLRKKKREKSKKEDRTL